jgi:hypothetical protein
LAPQTTRSIRAILANWFAVWFAVSACQRTPDETTGTATSSSSTSLPTTPEPAKFDRIAIPEMATFGPQSGWIEGGVVYAAVRPTDAIAALRAIPLPAEVAREVAEAGDELGVDLRAEDLARRFALTDGAVISMTLARPIGPRTDALRTGLMRGGALLDALAVQIDGTDASSGAKPPIVVPTETPVERPAEVPAELPKEAPPPPPRPRGEKDEVPVEVAPVAPVSPIVEPDVRPPVTPPPPIDPALRVEATKLVEEAAGLGLHFRIDVPVTDPEPLVRELERLTKSSGRDRWAEVCRSVAHARVCGGDARTVFIASTPAGRVQLDVIEFVTTASPLAGDRPATVRTAVGAPAAKLPALAELRGTAAMYIDAAAISRIHEIERIRHALQVLRWDSRPEYAQVGTTMATIDAVERMGQGTLLFDGVAVELLAAGDRVHGVVRWHMIEATRELAGELLGDRPTHATVPTHAALCDGALVCARTGGLPEPTRLVDRLGTGIWALESCEFFRTLDPDEPAQATHLFAASWPNLLAAAARWPVAEAGEGFEAGLARSVVDTVAKIEGYGGSLRSLAIGRNAVQADYVAYARTTAPDNAMLRGLLGFAEIRMQESTLAGVDGPVQFATLPEDDAPIVLSTHDERTPTVVEGKNVLYAWLAVVDGNDRMAWLLGLPRESSTGPRAYFEIPDLGRLVSSVPELDRDIGVLRGWLQGRGLRAALSLERGEARIEATLGPG